MQDNATTPENLTRFGFSIFPLNGGTGTDADKRPHFEALPKGADGKPTWKPFQLSHATADELEYWIEEFPGLNWAIACGVISGVIVLDIDAPEGQELAERFGLPITPSVRTANGRHYYFKHPGFECANKGKDRGGFPPGMDFRGDGGYVVAPGSVHPSGVTYEWEVSPADVPFAEAPAWLLDLVRKQSKPKPARGRAAVKVAIGGDRYAEVALEGNLNLVASTVEGSKARNDTLNYAAFRTGQLIGAGRGLDRSAVVEQFISAATRNGLSEKEARSTAERAVDAGIANPRQVEPLKPIRRKEELSETTVGEKGEIDHDSSAVDVIEPKRYDNTVTDAEGKKRISLRKVLENAESYLQEHYEIRFNVVLQRAEYRQKNSTWEELSDRDANALWRELVQAGIPLSAANLDKLLGSDFAPDFDPFVDYFGNLAAWDEKTDHIGNLAAKVTVDGGIEEQQRFARMFRKYIVGLVACAIMRGIANHLCLIFTGRQGSGKTTFFNRLIPQALGSKYLHCGAFKADHRDSTLRLASKLLINLDELEGMNRGDLTNLKSYITADKVNERLVYGRRDVTQERRASFCGSVNSDTFLQDSTGSRRFLVFRVESIEGDGWFDYDMDNVYAQAYALLQKGEVFHLDQKEIAQNMDHNRAFEVVGFEEELLLKYYQPADQDEIATGNAIEYTADELAKSIMGREELPPGGRDRFKWGLGKALARHGFIKKAKKEKGQYKRVYFVNPAKS